MGLDRSVEDHFVGLGFRLEWVWLGRESLFLIAWKGRTVQVHFVDPDGRIAAYQVESVLETYLEFLSHVRKLEKWDRIFKGRDIEFRWLALREPSPSQTRMLREAGIESFVLPPT